MRLLHLAVSLLCFLALTGVGLLFHYRPDVSAGYLDLIDLREVSRFGFLRDLHLWASHAAVIVIWLHLLRAALRGRASGARRREWRSSVVLAVLTLMLATTGTLLPWDQDAFWGIATVWAPGEAATAAESPAVDGSTLLRAYVLHCFVLPLLLTGLVAAHLRRSRGVAEKR
ncbi:MAG: DUF4405 domain-containing protein [bacterium]|nr:DUF4405 domain-containing protein [bacterium]